MNWMDLFPRTTQPGFEEIGAVLQNPLWDGLNAHLEETYGVTPNVEYSVCSGAPGWNVKYKKSGRSLCVLYPNLEWFTCLVCIGPKEQMEAELLLHTCTQYTRELYESSGGVNGTRWMMLAVTSPEILEDVKDLISLRVKKRR